MRLLKIEQGAEMDAPKPKSEATAPASPAEPQKTGSGAPKDVSELEEAVIETLKNCYDPEIPVDIYELGLIYKVQVSDEGDASIDMTLTSPACPVAGSLPGEVEQRVKAVPGIRNATIELVWDPPWDQERMSEAAKLQLGFL